LKVDKYPNPTDCKEGTAVLFFWDRHIPTINARFGKKNRCRKMRTRRGRNWGVQGERWAYYGEVQRREIARKGISPVCEKGLVIWERDKIL